MKSPYERKKDIEYDLNELYADMAKEIEDLQDVNEELREQIATLNDQINNLLETENDK